MVLDEDGYVRITDLGIARVMKAENSNDTSGTPGYMGNYKLLIIIVSSWSDVSLKSFICSWLFCFGCNCLWIYVGKSRYFI